MVAAEIRQLNRLTPIQLLDEEILQIQASGRHKHNFVTRGGGESNGRINKRHHPSDRPICGLWNLSIDSHHWQRTISRQHSGNIETGYDAEIPFEIRNAHPDRSQGLKALVDNCRTLLPRESDPSDGRGWLCLSEIQPIFATFNSDGNMLGPAPGPPYNPNQARLHYDIDIFNSAPLATPKPDSDSRRIAL